MLFLAVPVGACSSAPEVPVSAPLSAPNTFAVRLVPAATRTPSPPRLGQEPTPAGPTPTAAPAEPAKAPEVLCPLSGMPVSPESQHELRAFALKVDNAPPGWPQSGLSRASLVHEYLAEGGITRLLALFHNEDDDTPIGPVRSMRMVDIDLVPQFDAVFGFVGSSARTARAYSTSNILDMNQFFNPGAYSRVPWRRPPYNVYTSVAQLKQASAANGWHQPSSIEAYAFSANPPPDAAPVSVIAIPFHATNVVEFRYDPERRTYLRFVNGRPQIDANNDEQIEAANVIVQYVRQRVTNFFEDAGGAPSLETEVIGEGEAEIFRDGIVIPARWVHENRTQRVQFLDAAGYPIAFKPGNTWIALLREGTR